MTSTRDNVGPLVRRHRERARFSQMALALEIGVSTRHLGFVELGRSRPSPELLMAIAERLDVPLRERNEWLLTAGYAPRYAQTHLDAPTMRRVRSALQTFLDGQNPYPAVALDRGWNVELTNHAAQRLTDSLPAHVLEPTRNVFRIALHPDGFASRSANFAEWSPYVLRNLDRVATRTDDPALRALAIEAQSWPAVPARKSWSDPAPTDPESTVLTWRIRLHDQDLTLFTIMSVIGTPLDIGLSELTIETFVPADSATHELLWEWSQTSQPDGIT
ncbi:helix-turn-helix transcriptional regulator [Nocardia sp. NPDC004604]|uniref:helix-turn-helix domain-containing protein n=1 Tax=Nocardia sp. NPDC004604 TaxID=3157013 RepID=UPI0033A7F081